MGIKKTTETKKCRKTVKNLKVPTLLEAIERVVELSRDSKLSDDVLLSLSPDANLLAERFNITPMQAILFCICMEKGPRRVDFNDLARHLDVSCIRILGFAADIDALVRRRLLRYRNAEDEEEFDIPIAVIKALKHNEVYELPKRTGLDCPALFELLDMLMEDLDDGAVAVSEFNEEIGEVLENNRQIAFVQKLKERDLDEEERNLLLLFCHKLVNKDDEDIRSNEMECIYDDKAEFNRMKAELRKAEHPLIEKNLIEPLCVDGVVSTGRYKMTESAKRDLLAELNIVVQEAPVGNLLKFGDLTPKQMFYTREVDRQVGELSAFFQQEKFCQIRERMQQRGFRHGFACLFYGGPGTGKTETVYQLARHTGRHIMVVDVPQIKSKWVGDSEKNIKALFDRYRELVKRDGTAPILLFNEADAIIGTRKSHAENAVDKMENTIQNIILQEMEALDGIMIATTNLEENFDSAFERRFLYKIKFEKPDASVRSAIWQQMIPELAEQEAATLAESYDFSGGQIENIARKHAIHSVLHGNDKEQLATLRTFCDTEQLANKRVVRRIGY